MHCRPAGNGRQEQDRQQATGRGQRHRPLVVFLEEADFEAKVDIVAEDDERIGTLEGTEALQGSQWACPSMSAPNGTSVQHTAQGEIHYAWTQHLPHLSVQKRHCYQGTAFLELERLCKFPIEVTVHGALSRAIHSEFCLYECVGGCRECCAAYTVWQVLCILCMWCEWDQGCRGKTDFT